jgi:hypothetical protein
MPNIGESFGASLNSTLLMKPLTDEKKAQIDQNEESKAGTSKQQEESKPTIGLYEELLASSTGNTLRLIEIDFF